jgi:cytochrome c-type biogenesis protein CcmH/NrfF
MAMWLTQRIRRPSLAMLMLVAGLFLACIPATSAFDEQDRTGARLVEADAQAIFHRVLSPYCPGLLLSACTSGAAEVLREEVRAALRAGEPRTSVEAALYQRFGDGVRAEPTMRGIGLLLWIAPLVLLAASGWWLLSTVRRWSAAPPHARDGGAAEPPPLFDDALEERLRAELDTL